MQPWTRSTILSALYTLSPRSVCYRYTVSTSQRFPRVVPVHRQPGSAIHTQGVCIKQGSRERHTLSTAQRLLQMHLAMHRHPQGGLQMTSMSSPVACFFTHECAQSPFTLTPCLHLANLLLVVMLHVHVTNDRTYGPSS